MSINVERKTLNLDKCVMRENISKWIEQDIIVPDTKPDAVKIINVGVNPYVTNVEVMDGKVKIIGNINYFIIYRVNDERFNTRGLYVSYPYTETLNVKGVNKLMNVSVKPVVKNIIYSLPNERKMAIKTEITFKVIARDMVCVNLINRFNTDDDIECKMCEGNFNNVLNRKQVAITSKEDIMLPKEAEDFFEILDVEPNIRNTEYKESYNKIMVKGDINAKIMYLAEEVEDGVKIINIQIPFSTMIEFENINDNSRFDIDYLIQDFSLKLNEDITSTKTLRAEYQVEADVTMSESQLVEYVEDFYSQRMDLKYDVEEVNVVKRNNNIKNQLEIKESMSNILEPNFKVVDYKIDTNFINSTINSDIVTVDGSAKINIIMQNMETFELDTKTIDVLISGEIKLEDLTPTSKIYAQIKDGGVSVNQNGNDLEVKIVIGVDTEIEDVANINMIDNIAEENKENMDLDSMNIYIVKPGDTLWSIAKKYKTSVEKIANTNNIEDVDSISVGQKILIIR